MPWSKIAMSLALQTWPKSNRDASAAVCQQAAPYFNWLPLSLPDRYLQACPSQLVHVFLHVIQSPCPNGRALPGKGMASAKLKTVEVHKRTFFKQKYRNDCVMKKCRIYWFALAGKVACGKRMSSLYAIHLYSKWFGLYIYVFICTYVDLGFSCARRNPS